MKVPISRPWFGPEEQAAVLVPLETGWVVQGPQVAAFEAAFSRFTGAAHCVATTSCTSALHLALILAGVGPGDEVIVPALTWVATANVVEMQGARPVFVDVDPVTFNLDVAQAAEAITPRTRVILAVSLFGLSADLDPLRALAQRHGLRLVEDAACAFGTTYRGVHAGTLADFGCFSFHPRKAITTGEGGMLTTQDAALAAAARSLRDHGASVSDLARHHGPAPYRLPEFDAVGYNYRMTDLQGALGVVQMTRAEEILRLRRALAANYDEALRGLTRLRRPSGEGHSYQSYVTVFDGSPEERNQLMERLQEAGVSTRPGTHAVPLLGYYRERYGLRPEDFPAARDAERLSIALPLYALLTSAEQAYVVEQLCAFFT